MLGIFVTRNHRYTFEMHFECWGRSLRDRVELFSYEQLASRRHYPRAAYIFSDLERLSPAQIELAGMAADQFLAAGLPVFNHPRKTLRRYALLKKLADEGINDFRAYYLAERPPNPAFPVFLRTEHDHNGSLTELLQNDAELDSAIAALPSSVPRQHVLIVEYCHTASEDGLFRKYSAIRMGTRTFARHVLFARDWVVKGVHMVDESTVREELEYVRNDPHGPEVRRVFDLAAVDFGRIDYGVSNQRIRVWEINTNPTLTFPPLANGGLPRMPVQFVVAEHLQQAFAEAADRVPESAQPLMLHIPRAVARVAGFGIKRRAARKMGRLLKKLENFRIGKALAGRWRRMRELAE